MLDRITPPLFQPIDYPVFSWPKAVALDTGLPCWQLNTGTQPVVKLELIFDGGTLHEPSPGIAYFATKMLLEGTQHRDVQAIAQYIDQYGASLTAHVQPDSWSLTLITLSKHLLPMLQLFTEVLLLPKFTTSRLEHLKHLKGESLKLAAEKNSQVARWHFQQLLFGTEHPYGRLLDETAVSAVTLAQVEQYYTKQFLTGCRAFVSGQLTDQMLLTIQEHLQLLPVQKRTTAASAALISSSQRLHVPKPKSLQAALNVGKALPKRNHPDYSALLVVNELLGGFFGSRLMRNLREEKGYTYGISSRVVPLQQTSYLLIATEVVQEHTEHACQEIEKEIDILQTTLVSSEELMTLRNYMLGAFSASVNTPFAVMDRFKTAYMHELNPDYYSQQYATVKHMNATQIRTLAQQYLSDLNWVVVGGANPKSV